MRQELSALLDERWDFWSHPGFAIHNCVRRFGLNKAREVFTEHWHYRTPLPPAFTNQTRAKLIALAPPPGVTVEEYVEDYGYQDRSVNAFNDHWVRGTKIQFMKDDKRTTLSPVPSNWDEWGNEKLCAAGVPDFDKLCGLGEAESAYRSSLPKRGYHWVKWHGKRDIALVSDGHASFFGSDWKYDLLDTEIREWCEFLGPVAPFKNQKE
jgi:hypothetical protein